MNISEKGQLAVILMALINVPAAAAAPAECTALFKNSHLFEAERVEMVHEFNRATALNKQPHKDAALCRALLRVMRDVPYFVIAEPTCFQDNKQTETYKTQIKQLGMDAASLAGIFCTDEEKRRGVKSKVLDGEP